MLYCFLFADISLCIDPEQVVCVCLCVCGGGGGASGEEKIIISLYHATEKGFVQLSKREIWCYVQEMFRII